MLCCQLPCFFDLIKCKLSKWDRRFEIWISHFCFALKEKQWYFRTILKGKTIICLEDNIFSFAFNYKYGISNNNTGMQALNGVFENIFLLPYKRFCPRNRTINKELKIIIIQAWKPENAFLKIYFCYLKKKALSKKQNYSKMICFVKFIVLVKKKVTWSRNLLTVALEW